MGCEVELKALMVLRKNEQLNVWKSGFVLDLHVKQRDRGPYMTVCCLTGVQLEALLNLLIQSEQFVSDLTLKLSLSALEFNLSSM